MTPLFKKLNLSNQSEVVVLNAPSSFETELELLTDVTVVRKLSAKRSVSFGLAFAKTQNELDQLSQVLIQSVTVDPVLWIAYPKGTSKTYHCEFNRDTGWDVLGQAGYEPVRQISIDHDWTALLFRKVTHIKKLSRRQSMTISAEGKKRTQSSRGK